MPEVAIAGGGPAGAVAALVLARLGVSVTVFEQSTEAADKIGDCLAPNTNPLLDLLDLRTRLAAGPHLQTYGNRSAWGSDGTVEHHFISEKHGAGWRLDRHRFEETLASAAMDAGVQWHYGARVAAAEWSADRWRVSVEQGAASRSHVTDFLVDATGRRSVLARGLAIERMRLDRLVAVAGTLSGGRPVEDTFTLVEAVSGGWWYSGMLRDGRLEVFLATDPGLPEYARSRSDSGWWSLLQQAPHTWERVQAHGGRLAGAPRVWAAGSERLACIAGERWLAIGDAAAAYDPISSHGIGSAMGSGYYAARAIADILQGHDEARDAYLTVMQRSYNVYAATHRQQYARERRWPDSPFWKARA